MFGLGGRKKSEKKASEMSSFERRKSMALKFEQDERAKSGGSIPPPATELIGKELFESPAKKKGSVRIKDPELPPPPPPSLDKKSADPEYIEFTVVPLLLRAKVAYDEANRYGESLKILTDGEVKIIMANVVNFIDDVKKSGIKTLPTFEKDCHEDMFWKAGPGNRKSFVYYRASDTPESGGRPKSDSSHNPVAQTRESTRQRASFTGPPLPVLEETDANRYKVKTRTKQAESLSNDLADLVSSLDKLSPPRKN